jgi:hypothetical protein
MDPIWGICVSAIKQRSSSSFFTLQNYIRQTLFTYDLQLSSPVFCTPFFGVIIRNRSCFTEPFGLQPGCFNAFGCEICHNRFCAVIREC